MSALESAARHGFARLRTVRRSCCRTRPLALRAAASLALVVADEPKCDIKGASTAQAGEEPHGRARLLYKRIASANREGQPLPRR
jgi:hypothetical protein